MPYVSQSRFVRSMAVATVGGLGIAAVSSGIALAAYGPPSPLAVPPPGGFSCILTSQTLGPAAKVIKVSLGTITAGISIPAGDFRTPVQITVTEPFGSGSCSGGAGIGDAGFPGFSALGGIGIQVQQHGKNLLQFPAPMTVRLGGSAHIHAGHRLVHWTGVKYKLAPESFTRHAVTTHISTSTDLALLVPGGHGPAPGHAARSGHAARAGGATRASGATTSLPGEILAAALALPHGSHPGLGILTGMRLRQTSVRARLLTR
jgi:hypothetical protein